MDEFQFENELLNSVTEKFKSIAEQQLINLEKINNDIKKLEKLLFKYCFDNGIRVAIDENSYLVWLDGRIRFKIDSSNDCRPLIECKKDIRILSSQFLHKLAEKCFSKDLK